MSLSRRTLLRASATASAGLIGGPAILSWMSNPAVAAEVKAFIDDYATNTTANLTVDTNAAVRILSGMQQLWQTGSAWNNGVVLAPEILRANVRYCEKVTATRTEAEAARAFIIDRQHQSYSTITGLGVLAPIYRAGALAVTSITSAPVGTPATTIDDVVPAGSPAGSTNGAGSPTSALGAVVALVNAVRGDFTSSNPSKFAYLYPRPWRMTRDSEVVDTGAVDAFGFPVYQSDVIVAPQLLRQRGTKPAEDGGFPSGHTNAVHLAALAYAYAVPERFQELVTCAMDFADTRIMSGMHSPVDVVGGRVLATALAAATLNNPKNAQIKADARAQAAAYLQAQTGTTADTLYAYAHSGNSSNDPYADRAANRKLVRPKLTYILPRQGKKDVALDVPKGAEVLLETRQPYLTAAQRRAVLRSTALPAGYALLDGPEGWGRLDLFTAADGYGAFESDVDVTLDAAAGGFGAADTWRNDIDGRGGLTLRGTGTLGLTGANRFGGGVRVLGGTLVAGSKSALGSGDVEVQNGTLRVTRSASVCGGYLQRGGVLAATLSRGATALTVDGPAEIGKSSTLELTVGAGCDLVPVLRARKLTGRFAAITVSTPGYRVEPVYTRTGLSVRVRRG